MRILYQSSKSDVLHHNFFDWWVLSSADVSFQRKPFLTAHTCFDPSNLGKTQRVCHSQVPVQWYTAQKGDADVDIRVEDEAKKLAALLSMDPVIVLQEVIYPQRKSGDVEEVCHWQVDQIDAKLVALPYLEGWENAEEDDGVGDMEEGWVRKEGENGLEQKQKCVLEQADIKHAGKGALKTRTEKHCSM